MNKQNHLNRWLWKWHIIAGLITLPIMVLLAITGTIYLFKADYEETAYKGITHVVPGKERLSYDTQLAAAKAATSKPIKSLTVPSSNDQATKFTSGMRRHKQTVYVNPYTGDVTGKIVLTDTIMFTIRNLHGELLTGKFGTYVVELVASWFIVLVLTGLYVWWPAKTFALAGFFTVRTKKGRHIFFRDLHSVIGFWLSLFMLTILAGGMPWTDVFGTQLKWVQKQTDTGYPATWQKTKNLQSSLAGQPFSLDQMVETARALNLPGTLKIVLPKSPKSVFSASNRAFYLSDQEVYHLDQYSGQIIKSHTWSDVGFLMDMRQIFMRVHQGEYGLINWVIVLVLTIIFTISTLAGLISYLFRKPAGRWGLPKVPEQFRVGKVLIAMIIILGAVFPMFGGSLILLWLWDKTDRFAFQKRTA